MYITLQFVVALLVTIIVFTILFKFCARNNVRFDPGTWKRGTAPRFMFVFAVGLSFGFAMATLLLSPYSPYEAMKMIKINMTNIGLGSLESSKKTDDITFLHHKMELNSTFANELLRGMEEITARRIANEVRVLCWIMTNPENHKDKAFHVKTTWGRHCNKLLFISEGEDPELPTVKLNVRSGRDGLWNKTISAFQYVYHNLKDEYDWVLKADDDTYVIIENLRSMLLPYSPSTPIYFGFHFKPYVPQGYMSGGAGYVLSKESVKRLVTQAFEGKNKKCPLSEYDGPEDLNIGQCLEAVGVKPGDSRDSNGRNRFFPFDVESHVKPDPGDKNWWYWDYIYWPMNTGLDCCSDTPISFHYVSQTKMYMLEYLVYHVKPFSVMHLSMAEHPPKEPEMTEEEKEKLKEEKAKKEAYKKAKHKEEEEKKRDEAQKKFEEKKKAYEDQKKKLENEKLEEEKKKEAQEALKKVEEEKKKAEEELKQAEQNVKKVEEVVMTF